MCLAYFAAPESTPHLPIISPALQGTYDSKPAPLPRVPVSAS
jgi:hypothetical protein